MTIALTIACTDKIVATPVTRLKNAPQLIERAKQLYQNEQYSAASRIWQQLATYQQGNVLDRAMALSNLALTQQKLGDLTAAQQAIACSLELL